MAELFAVGSAVIGKFAELLVPGVILSLGIKTLQVDELKQQLQSVRDVLKDAEQKYEKNPEENVGIWLDELRDVVTLMEDILEKYMLVLEQSQWRRNQHGFVNYLGRAGRLISKLNSHRNLTSNLRNINELLSEIQQRGARFNSADDRVGRRVRDVDLANRRMYLSSVDENVVGIDSTESQVVEWLIGGESRRSVVALVGAGGIGKTTVARKVFAAEALRGHFDCRIWASVTQSYRIEEILRTVATQIVVHDQPENIEAMEMSELTSTIRKSLLSKRRYLLVFDDVWDEDFLRFVKNVVPDDGNGSGSRIIITTRSDSVAACSTKTNYDYVKRLEPLSMEMTLALFRSKVFPNESNHTGPQELENLCLEFVRMCGGIPLAIVVVAGLLSTREKTVLEWQELLQNFHFERSSDNGREIVYNVLSLSFRALPDQLRSLFLYFSICPEDSLIPTDKLVKLWIAEGFIQEKQGMTLEEVAEEHLAELIRRNMVQASKGFYGLEKFCSVHDLILEMAQQKADKYHFCHIRADQKSSNFRGKSRRLSINNYDTRNVLKTIDDSQVRSAFLSNIVSLDNNLLVTLFGKHKLLTLLDVENVQLYHLPKEVGNLFNLKYLSLKNTKVMKLPKSVGKLQKLQTLDATNTQLVELPITINKLQNLRHLLASRYENESRLDSNKGVRINRGIGCLVNLQTLTFVEAHLSGMDVVQELNKLRQLRSLSLSGLTTELASALCACIEEMSHLESLGLYSKNKDENLDIQNISSPPPCLNRLILKGLLQSFPQWISHLQNLSMLCLSLSRLADDPLQHLCLLPKLESLWLYRAYQGKQLHFKEGGFKSLKLLVLREMQELEVVQIEEAALSSVEELRIGPSPCLHDVPSGIKHLRSLKVLSLYDMPNEFVLGLQLDGGSDYEKIEHVSSVLFWYKVPGRDYISYKLGDLGLLDRLQGLTTNINQDSHYDFRWSFSYSDDEESSASASVDQWDDSSDRLSRFSDDIED